MARPRGHTTRRPIRHDNPLFQEYLRSLKRRNRSDSTLANAVSRFKLLTLWMRDNDHQDVRHLKTGNLESFLIWLEKDHRRHGKKVNALTIEGYTLFLRSLYHWLHEENQILGNPSQALQLPRRPRVIHRDILSREELNRLLAAPDVSTREGLRDLAVLRVLSFSGLRNRELRNLNLEDIDLKGREIIVRQGKPRKDRLAFFDVKTRPVLARYLVHARPALARKGESAFFVDDRGNRFLALQLRKLVAAHAAKAGIGQHIVCHSLRRTFCTLLHRHGCNLKVIAELAGHKNLSTSARYTRVDIRELAEIYRQAHPRAGG